MLRPSQILTEILDSIGEFNIPHRLFHYTTAEGLLGICSSKSLWMTDLQFMNDASEIQYSRALFTEVLEEMSSGNDAEHFLHVVDLAKKLVKAGLQSLTIYSCSFCEEGNLLSQWRAYGSTGGYAIAFDLSEMDWPLESNFLTVKVVYERERQIDIIRKGIARLIRYREALSTAGEELKMADRVIEAFIVSNLSRFKHPEFSEEKEWRLVCHFEGPPELIGSSVKFRSNRDLIVPYITANLEKAFEASKFDERLREFPFVEVVIGPTVNSEAAKKSVDLLLQSLSEDVIPNVTGSEIPVRWL